MTRQDHEYTNAPRNSVDSNMLDTGYGTHPGHHLVFDRALYSPILEALGNDSPRSGVNPEAISLTLTLSANATRHKMNPVLIYTPLKARGLDLMSTPLAVKRQALKRATTWLMAPEDDHTAAWQPIVHPDAT